MKKYPNYIFDLGGVIINLNFQRAFHSFSVLSGLDVSVLEKMILHSNFLKEHETGKLSDDAFRQTIRQTLHHDLSDSQIDYCWNLILEDIPEPRIKIIKKLKENHRLFLFSNTNQIHYDCFTEILKKSHRLSGFHELFEKDYYSHKVHVRKPDPEAFLLIIRENRLKIEETCLIDDNEENIKSAQKLGLGTLHITAENNLEHHFKEILF